MQSSIWRFVGMGFPKLRVHEISPGQSYCARFYDAGFGYGSTALDDSLGNGMPFLVEEGAWGGVLICRQIRGIEREGVECTAELRIDIKDIVKFSYHLRSDGFVGCLANI